MVTVAQFIPKDAKQKESVLAVLREHPELQEFIVRASEKAEEIFPNVRITLDNVQYDEWDPPVRLLLQVSEPLIVFNQHYHRYAHWLAHEADYPQELVMVMPLWSGPRNVNAG